MSLRLSGPVLREASLLSQVLTSKVSHCWKGGARMHAEGETWQKREGAPTTTRPRPRPVAILLQRLMMMMPP